MRRNSVKISKKQLKNYKIILFGGHYYVKNNKSCN